MGCSCFHSRIWAHQSRWGRCHLATQRWGIEEGLYPMSFGSSCLTCYRCRGKVSFIKLDIFYSKKIHILSFPPVSLKPMALLHQVVMLTALHAHAYTPFTTSIKASVCQMLYRAWKRLMSCPEGLRSTSEGKNCDMGGREVYSESPCIISSIHM